LLTSAGVHIAERAIGAAFAPSQSIRAHIYDYVSCHSRRGDLHICLVLWCAGE
jgi:hypothetical protein